MWLEWFGESIGRWSKNTDAEISRIALNLGPFSTFSIHEDQGYCDIFVFISMNEMPLMK